MDRWMGLGVWGGISEACDWFLQGVLGRNLGGLLSRPTQRNLSLFFPANTGFRREVFFQNPTLLIA